MQKIVLNKSFGGFKLSEAAIDRLEELGHEKVKQLKEKYSYRLISSLSRGFKRNDPKLVQVVEELGSNAGHETSKLVVETIPKKEFFLRNYDGVEHVEVYEK